MARVQDTVGNQQKLGVINSDADLARGQTAVSGTIQYGIYDVHYRLESPSLIIYDTKVNWERAKLFASSATLAILIALFPEAAPAVLPAVAYGFA